MLRLLPYKTHKLNKMAKSKDYLKKSFDSIDWRQISKSQIEKEVEESALEVLEKTGRIKTASAIYQKA